MGNDVGTRGHRDMEVGGGLDVGGDRDPSLGPMKVMHRKIKGSRLVVLSPASHFANRDQPEAWNRAALQFLARVDGGKRRSA